jgi:hypothetical protein
LSIAVFRVPSRLKALVLTVPLALIAEYGHKTALLAGQGCGKILTFWQLGTLVTES